MFIFNKYDSDQAVSRVLGKGVAIYWSKQLPTGNWEESQEGSQKYSRANLLFSMETLRGPHWQCQSTFVGLFCEAVHKL